MRKLTQDEKIRGILGGAIVPWAWSVMGRDPSREELMSLLDIDRDYFKKYVEKNGFDEEAVSEAVPLDSRYLIEPIENGWQTSFFERGTRIDIQMHKTRDAAVAYLVEELIRMAEALLKGSFNVLK